MRSRCGLRTVLLLVCLLIPSLCTAAVITLSFDELGDLDPVGNRFAEQGVRFTGAVALTAGLSLVEAEFPPRSAPTVASDENGLVELQFSVPVTAFTAYFTYAAPVFLQAFNAANVAVDSESSAFGSNLSLSGEPGSTPNEALTLAFGGGFRRITIQASAPQTIAFDDVTFATAADPQPVPEPSPGAMLAVAAGCCWVWQRRA